MRSFLSPLRLFLIGLVMSGQVFFIAQAEERQLLIVAAYPAIDDVLKSTIPQWKQLHPNVDIKIISRQFADHHTAMTTALSTSYYLPDVMVLEVGYVGRFAQGGGLEDLSKAPYRIDQHRSKYVPYAYAQAINRKGEVVAAPSDIGPGTMLYRADVLEKAGVSIEEMTKSWDSYVAAGIKIKKTTGAYLVSHARNVKDIIIRSGVKEGDGLYFDKESNVLVNSPRFVRAFELAKKIHENHLAAQVNTWSNEWSEGFKRGTIATEMTGAWLAGHLNNWIAPKTKGLWRASQLPENTYAAYGGSFYAIARHAPDEKKKLAWELIKLMTLNRDVQISAFKAQDAFPALVETFDDSFFEKPIAFLGDQHARKTWRSAVSNITAVSVHKQDAFADEIINTELDKVLVRGKAISAALIDAERLLKYRAKR